MFGNIAHDIQKVHNFESLVDFLRDTLYWPIPDKGLEFEEITYDWSAEALELDANTQARIVSCRQLQLYDLKFDLSAASRRSNTQPRPERVLTTRQKLLAAEQGIANAVNKLHEMGMDAETIASKIGMDLASVTKILKTDTESHQVQLFDCNLSEDQQSWGIFFIQFDNNVELDACRTLLRRVLRGLVDRRGRSVSLPFWQHNRLLFICTTTDFQNIGFACFSGRQSRPIVDDYIPLNYFRLDS